MDLDLFLYRESAPFQPVFPNEYARNHHYNAEESVLIRESHPYWEPGLFIAKVTADDSVFTNNFYDIVAIDHCTFYIHPHPYMFTHTHEIYARTYAYINTHTAYWIRMYYCYDLAV